MIEEPDHTDAADTADPPTGARPTTGFDGPSGSFS